MVRINAESASYPHNVHNKEEFLQHRTPALDLHLENELTTIQRVGLGSETAANKRKTCKRKASVDQRHFTSATIKPLG